MSQTLVGEETRLSKVVGHAVPAVVLGAALVAVAHDRRPVIDAESLRGKAIPPIVREAGLLQIEWTATRYRECGTIIAREIVDSANTVFRLDQESGPRSSTLGKTHGA